MAIQLNSNIRVAAPAPIDKRYLSERTVGGSPLPYSATTEVFSIIPSSERYVGLTVNVQGIEYWFKTDINTLIVKTVSGATASSLNAVTGATNIGFFSGYSGIQTLTLSGFGGGFDGNYYSEYNYYYLDSQGYVRLGSPIYHGALRRGFVNAARTKSWIYNTNSLYPIGWILSSVDVSVNLGNQVPVVTYTPPAYSQVTWSGFNTNGTSSINASGSLITGSTITIGSPVFSDKQYNELRFRTIKSKTPSIINISNDDSFVYFSGSSTQARGQNVGFGIGVYSGISGNNLYFKSLAGSGSTTVSQIGNTIYISSSGGTGSTTTASNIGTGVGIYDSKVGSVLEFRSLVGSGGTTISHVGNNIIIYSSGGSGGGVFTQDLVVSIAAGKTFGKYLNGDTIPALGKTANDVIKMAIAEALTPTVNLTNLGTGDVSFGQANKSVNLSFSYTINTLGAHVSSVSLQYNRGAGWNVLTTSTGATTYTHNINDTGNRFNTTAIQYKYIVVDSAGASGTTIITVTPQAYAAPSISSILNGTITSPETQNAREKGNVISSPSGTITSNRSLVNITAWTLQRRYNGGSYTILASGSGLNTPSVSIPSTLDNTIPTSVTSIDYLITYTDQYTTGNGGAQTITFKYFSYWGYNTNITLTQTQIKALVNKDFLSSQALTWNGVTATGSNYTYYTYPSTYSDISSIIKNGIAQDFGAWSQLSQVSVTNTYGESLNYKVWKTNATSAYTGDNLVFS